MRLDLQKCTQDWAAPCATETEANFQRALHVLHPSCDMLHWDPFCWFKFLGEIVAESYIKAISWIMSNSMQGNQNTQGGKNPPGLVKCLCFQLRTWRWGFHPNHNSVKPNSSQYFAPVFPKPGIFTKTLPMQDQDWRFGSVWLFHFWTMESNIWGRRDAACYKVFERTWPLGAFLTGEG